MSYVEQFTWNYTERTYGVGTIIRISDFVVNYGGVINNID